MPRYTKGPWIAHTELLTPGGLHVTGRSPSVRAGQHMIAAVNRFLNDRLNHSLCAEAEANACLIAACPTMYEYILECAKDDPRAQTIIKNIGIEG